MRDKPLIFRKAPTMKLRSILLSLAALSLFGQGQDEKPNPKVEFKTTLGSFVVELEPAAAPKTVENFLEYAKSGFYKGTTFHRVISNFMVQGGGEGADRKLKTPTRGPVVNEARRAAEKGLKNVRGSLAMARSSAPDSATCQFFVNVVDNPFLDYPGQDGAGYCVFGRVAEGMETIDKIRSVKTGQADRPLENVAILDVKILGAKVSGANAEKAGAK
jgi:peptidyl-prolyl cis-trans isomerase A (cyclophilin A)